MMYSVKLDIVRKRSVFAPHHGGENAGIEMERRNYVTVTVCIGLCATAADVSAAETVRAHA